MKTFLRISGILALVLSVSCNSKPASSGEPEKKTFDNLKKHALFLESGHDKYGAFTDDEIKIVKVTNLNKSGEGSFADAVGQSGPRIVVFEVGGVIDMEQSNIGIKNPYLYIAGQTAPTPGITIIEGAVYISTHDVLVQHICVRPGDCNLQKRSGWEADGLSTNAAYNVVIDRCSFTWATDENLSASGPRHEGASKTSHDVTFSNCIISEGLYEATHVKGIHSMGTLIHDYCRNIAVVGNLYSHNNHRNPVLKPNAVAYIANNLIYNPKSRAIHAYWPVSEYEEHPDSLRRGKATVLGNVMIPGADTRKDMFLISADLKVYAKDNLVVADPANPNVSDPNRIIAKEVEILPKPPVETDKYSVIEAKNVVAAVLKNAGSRSAARNDIDQRIVNDVMQLKGRVIDSQNEVGGYPSEQPVTHEFQIPEKGIERLLEKLSKELTTQ